jgi:16S rRNA U516 pseudouridylate synthase RsuA-like enzyme
MNEDELNMQIRKFLKEVGVTSQREIEKAVREAVEAGKIDPNGAVKATMVLKIEELGLEHHIEHAIKLS